MKRIIVLNGPPRCGKDTLAKALVEATAECKWFQMKDHLIELACLIAKVRRADWDDRYGEQYGERWFKDVPWDLLPKNPMTGYKIHFSQRQFLIYVSEVICKQHFGWDYFGKSAAKNVANSDDELFVFSDGGFIEEINELLKVCDDMLIVHITRQGTDWGEDSRSYLYPSGECFSTVLGLDNSGTIQDALKPLLAFVNNSK